MKNELVFIPISLDELKTTISEVVRAELDKNGEKRQEPDLITRKEAAKLFGVTLVTIHQWVKNGKIKAYKIGSRVRFKKDELLGLVNDI